jgi:hypothetical protein
LDLILLVFSSGAASSSAPDELEEQLEDRDGLEFLALVTIFRRD